MAMVRTEKRTGICVLLLTALVLFTTAAMYAQDGTQPPPDAPAGERVPHGPHSPGMELDHLAREMKAASLPLSDTQKASILGVLEDRETAMSALRQNSTDRAAAGQQMRSLMQSSHAAIRALLTEAQAKVFDNLKPPAPRGGQQGATPGEQSGGEGQPGGRAEQGSAPFNETSSLIDANTGGTPEMQSAQ